MEGTQEGVRSGRYRTRGDGKKELRATSAPRSTSTRRQWCRESFRDIDSPNAAIVSSALSLSEVRDGIGCRTLTCTRDNPATVHGQWEEEVV